MASPESFVLFTNYFSAKVFCEALLKESKVRDFKIFTMSFEAYRLLKENNFEPFLVQSRKAEDFSREVVAQLPRGAALYLPGPSKRAFPMKLYLEERGFKAYNLDCYRTLQKVVNEKSCSLTEEEKALIVRNGEFVICFFSPSAALAFLKEFKAYREVLKQRVLAITVGPTTDKACRDYFLKCYQAEKPSVDSVLEVFESLRGKEEGVLTSSSC